MQSVAKLINESGDIRVNGAYALTGLGDVEPVSIRGIDRTVDAGEEIIDGVRVSFEAVVNAESSEQLTIGFPEDAILITQDIIWNRVHAFIGEHNFDAWIDAIDALEARPYDTILPGHGLPGDRSLYADARAYLTAARAAFAEASGPDDLNRRLEAAFPDYGGTARQPVQNYYLYPDNH